MRYSTQIKPISYPKANAAEVPSNLSESREPLALLQILALGQRDIAEGRLVPASVVFEHLKQKGQAEAEG